jgi:hypothetical protein
VLRRWVRQYRDDPAHAFPSAGQMQPEQAEIAQLKKEVRKLKAERDIMVFVASGWTFWTGVTRSAESAWHGWCGL